jgi:hypothetical protein
VRLDERAHRRRDVGRQAVQPPQRADEDRHRHVAAPSLGRQQRLDRLGEKASAAMP